MDLTAANCFEIIDQKLIKGGETRRRANLLGAAGDLDELVALLVDQQLADDALEALPTQAPDSVVAVST